MPRPDPRECPSLHEKTLRERGLGERGVREVGDPEREGSWKVVKLLLEIEPGDLAEHFPSKSLFSPHNNLR